MSHTVEVEIRAPREMAALDGATVHLRVEEVQEDDGPTTLVAERVLQGVGLTAGCCLTAAVELPDGAVRQNAEYRVRVVVERRGDGRVRSGDFVSVHRPSVLTYGRPCRVEVPIRPVP